MPEKMLSFHAGDSTPGPIKPVAYDIIEVPVIENNNVRKIAHDATTTFLTSECRGAKIIYGILDVVMTRLVMDGGLWRLCAEEGSAIRRLCTQVRGIVTSQKRGGITNG